MTGLLVIYFLGAVLISIGLKLSNPEIWIYIAITVLWTFVSGFVVATFMSKEE